MQNCKTVNSSIFVIGFLLIRYALHTATKKEEVVFCDKHLCFKFVFCCMLSKSSCMPFGNVGMFKQCIILEVHNCGICYKIFLI